MNKIILDKLAFVFMNKEEFENQLSILFDEGIIIKDNKKKSTFN